MAAVAGELSKQIKGHSEGAACFRPWWDTVEDNVLYAFVVLGMIALPVSFFSKTPVECTLHPDRWDNVTSAPGLARLYPKTFCAETKIEPFVSYLPFTILLVPIVLTAVEKAYVVLYKVEAKMNKFHSLLVKESLEAGEDVLALASENVRDCHEIEQEFKASSGCHASYVQRTGLEIVGSVGVAVLFALHHDAIGIGDPHFECDVHGYLFLCILPNGKFFMYIYTASFALISVYFACSVYNFCWVVMPKVGVMSRFLEGLDRDSDYGYKKSSPKALNAKPAVRLKLYFQPYSKDFRLLVNLLSESQGFPSALRVLALFEHQFASLWEPNNIRIRQRPNDLENEEMQKIDILQEQEEMIRRKSLRVIDVEFDDAEIANYFEKTFKKKFAFEYSVEVVSLNKEIDMNVEAPIKSILYFRDMTTMAQFDDVLDSSKLLDRTSNHSSSYGDCRKYKLCFFGLEPGQAYRIVFSTEVDGKTVAQIVRSYYCVSSVR